MAGRFGAAWRLRVETFGHALLLVVAITFLFKLAFADEWYWSKWFFYVPVPVLLVAGLTGVLWAGGLSKSLRAACAVLILLLSLAALHVDQPGLFRRSDPMIQTRPQLRVVTWNVMGYFMGEERVAEHLVALGPDVLILVEGTFAQRRPPELAKILGPDYTWAVGSRLSIASRLPLIESRQLADEDGIKVFAATIEVDRTPVEVVAVDFLTPRHRDDRAAWGALEAALERLGPTAIVAGDLNTPRGGRHLGRVLHGWRCDFETASGLRWMASWPTPLPLWQIDHSFSRGAVVPLAAAFDTTWLSDHKVLVVDYAVSANPE